MKRTTLSERCEKRLALMAARKKAREIKRRFRSDQRRYLRLKRERTMLTRAERAAYLESHRAFMALCQELRIVEESLRHSRKEVEADKALPRQAREALIYAKAFNDGKEVGLRMQAELVHKEAR